MVVIGVVRIGRFRVASCPHDSISFIFVQFSAKIYQIIRLWPKHRDYAPVWIILALPLVKGTSLIQKIYHSDGVLSAHKATSNSMSVRILVTETTELLLYDTCPLSLRNVMKTLRRQKCNLISQDLDTRY